MIIYSQEISFYLLKVFHLNLLASFNNLSALGARESIVALRARFYVLRIDSSLFAVI